jgi:hypothetical protein
MHYSGRSEGQQRLGAGRSKGVRYRAKNGDKGSKSGNWKAHDEFKYMVKESKVGIQWRHVGKLLSSLD